MTGCKFQGPTHSHEQAPLSPTTWYRVENVREALVAPGQWYLDRRSGMVTYLSFPGEDLRQTRVIAPRLARLVQLEGDAKRGTFVEHLIFRGLTLAHTAWNVPSRGYGHPQAEAEMDGAVTARHARGCALEK